MEATQKYYTENKERLLNILLEENPGRIDQQAEFDQVAVWFDGFSICYQNGDMNGGHKGQAVWWNQVEDEPRFVDTIKTDPRFTPLFDSEDEPHWDLYGRELWDDFCRTYELKHPEITRFFETSE